ncbi:MAG: hypothetical protein JMDDDDMK_01628 [Acidobacteria bacterium]|nr:hypothetical protein [Acidobacteriota bacterium]
MNTIKNFFNDETGLELSEYAVAAGLIALAVVAAFTALGTQINAAIDALRNKIVTT